MRSAQTPVRRMALTPRLLLAQAGGAPITRAIPKTRRAASDRRARQLRDVQPSGGRSGAGRSRSPRRRAQDDGGARRDSVRHRAGLWCIRGSDRSLLNQLGLRDKVFWATKLNVAGRGSAADPAAARAQVETSFERVGGDKIDLIQVHNVADMATQFPILEDFKARGPSALHRHDHDVQAAVRDARAAHARRAVRLHRHRLRGRQLERGGADLPARAARRASPCWCICRSAARASGSASRGTRCPVGPASSARRPGRNSS